MNYAGFAVSVLSLLLWTGTLRADDASADLEQLRQMLNEMKSDYENRIEALETRLAEAERLARSADRNADEAFEIAEDTAISATAGASSPNTFNPALGAVLVARYADVDQGWEDIPGFISGGELGPGGSGFSLGESEINLDASVDDRFIGKLTLALEAEGGETELALEEAWVQTTALAPGLALTGGRFFSEAGYLNKFHRHADDFVDRPLPYQAFFGGQYIVDGARARWIAPTPLLLEVGAELNIVGNVAQINGLGIAEDPLALIGIAGDRQIKIFVIADHHRPDEISRRLVKGELVAKGWGH